MFLRAITFSVGWVLLRPSFAVNPDSHKKS